MPVITRNAATVTTPFGGGGAQAFNSSNSTSGSASVNASSSNGGAASSQLKTCQWSNFGSPVTGSIVSVKLKYDWSWNADANGSVDSNGSCSANGSAGGGVFSGGAGINLNGPGPVSDFDSDGFSGSADITLPNNTVLSTVATDAFADADAESGIVGSTGSASANASVSLSSIRVEITTVVGGSIACCF